MGVFNCVVFLSAVLLVRSSDISNLAFGKVRNGIIAAFGDFNSDELTDMFILRNKRRTVEIMLAHDEEPLLRSSNLKCNFTRTITSVVPGDFDGDAFMDILVTTADAIDSKETYAHIIWGGLDHLNCTNESKPILELTGQPLAIDYNQDMIIDLFGVDKLGERSFWVFNSSRSAPEKFYMSGYPAGNHIRHPHSNAFLDLNDDNMPDLFVTGTKSFEIWTGNESGGYRLNRTFDIAGKRYEHVGQAVFLDFELKGELELLVPVCKDRYCGGSELLVERGGLFHDLQVGLRDPEGVNWRFVRPDAGKNYLEAIIMRAGDFNMDGYPDLLTTLEGDGKPSRAFLLENIPCTEKQILGHCRSFRVRWDLAPSQKVVTAAFYDFYQDGVLDIVFVYENLTLGALRNSLDYDANFVKVMVLTGLTNNRNPTIVDRLGKRKRRTYGTNLPGPVVSYRTTTQEGDLRHGASPQLPQSAHNALGLPFTIFGLGRTPNFVDSLTVGLSGRSRFWTQIIPNSQMVVIPWPAKDPTRWKAQLFVTPSKLILMSVAALTAICGLITCIIGALYWRERQEDRKERLQESHRFHFDAM